jgi:hypothetical protein
LFFCDVGTREQNFEKRCGLVTVVRCRHDADHALQGQLTVVLEGLGSLMPQLELAHNREPVLQYAPPNS